MKLSLKSLIWILILVALGIAGVLAFLPQPIEVETATVRQGTLVVTVEEDGKTRIREKYVVSAPVAGRLTRIELNEGDEVIGDESLIAVIQPAPPAMLDARAKAQADARVLGAQAAMQRAEVNLETSQVNHDLSKIRLDRSKRLLESNSISTDEYDEDKADFLASQHAIESAKFGVDIARFELEMAEAAAAQLEPESAAVPFEIKAPIAGKVLRVFQESASVVAVGTPLLELGDPQNLEMEIDVLSTDAVRIGSGARVEVLHWGGDHILQGSVRIVEPAAFTKVSSLGVEEQRVNVIADFDESLGQLAALGDGFRIEARITVAVLPDVLMIPNSALFRHRRQWHVFVVENDQASLRAVETGQQNQSHTAITAGLNAGDVVVVYPGDELSTGATVRPLPREAEESESAPTGQSPAGRWDDSQSSAR